jgi:hypothetical protein
MTDRERLSRPEINTAPMMKFSPNALKNLLEGVATWFPTEERPVRTEEFVAANLPEAALKLGLKPIEGRFFARPSALNLEDQIKFAVAIVDESKSPGQVHWCGGNEYNDEQLISVIRNQQGDGRYFVETFIEDAEEVIDLIEAGNIVLDPNK